MSVYMDLLFDLGASDINHPQKHLHLERYEYSGDGLGRYDFKAGENIYEAIVNVWSVSGSGHDEITGFGRSVDEAVCDAVRGLKTWLQDRVANCAKRVTSEQGTLKYYERMLQKVSHGV